MADPKILLYDIEISPIIGAAWGVYEQDLFEIIKPWEILSVSHKWLGLEHIETKTRADFKDKTDKRISQYIWDLINKSDIVVSHNGLRFDNKRCNARFLFHKFRPLGKFHNIDTLAEARRHFGFMKNGLGDLCEFLNLGKKMEVPGGKSTWIKAMNGDSESLAVLGKYNQHDVRLLERLYLRMRPWIQNHPNLTIFSGRPDSCPRCGSDRICSNGLHRTSANTYRRFLCRECGSKIRENGPVKNFKPRFLP